ncbi:1080_t:CDS:10 [Acaulospora morrowiae]|uniref:1080_t:CDS:1 n=1 Tax=Acaulospora morrowiae TaxID=94023 RepID=A0A9N8Z8X0_9GLOM|nr:1080_t:CDS:10 [Acaulospora morrowiae]
MTEYFVGKLEELEEKKVKEVTVKDNLKVLLSKFDGQVYATSHKCTHYGVSHYWDYVLNYSECKRTKVLNIGFPYQRRLFDPWHGACFNLTTGDIEDAPALDHLQKYKVIMKGNDIYIETNESTLKAARRIPKCSSGVSPFNDYVVVIIGGGAAGNAAAEKLREDGFEGRIVIISRETYLPIDRPKLSKGLGMQLEKIELRKKEFYNDMYITLKLGMSVTAVDSESKVVTISNNEKFKYDSLIIATGASPRSIPIPGIDLGGVLYLRTYDDHKRIENAVAGEEKKNVVIIGSSFIGMEVAAICAKKANVSVIGMETVPFERILGLEVGRTIQKLHETNNVKFYMSASVKGIEPSSTDPTKVGAVIINDGVKIPADIIVVGAGVAPATEFLKDSRGFTLEKDGSIKVDENFKVVGLKDVYAIGDIARFPYHITGESLRIEHWSFAVNTGRAVAELIAKKRLVPFKRIPYFWSAQYGKSLRYAGYASSYDDVIVHGSLEELKFAVYYSRGDKVLAVATLGKDPLASHCAELLRLGLLPSATEIRAGKDPLDIEIKA